MGRWWAGCRKPLWNRAGGWSLSPEPPPARPQPPAEACGPSSSRHGRSAQLLPRRQRAAPIYCRQHCGARPAAQQQPARFSSNPAASRAAKASGEQSQTPNPSPEPRRVRAWFPARCELLCARVGFVPTSHGQTRAPLAWRGGIACPEPVRFRRVSEELQRGKRSLEKGFYLFTEQPPKKNT